MIYIIIFLCCVIVTLFVICHILTKRAAIKFWRYVFNLHLMHTFEGLPGFDTEWQIQKCIFGKGEGFIILYTSGLSIEYTGFFIWWLTHDYYYSYFKKDGNLTKLKEGAHFKVVGNWGEGSMPQFQWIE